MSLETQVAQKILPCAQSDEEVENGQRRIDPSKIESITKLAPPSSVPELRSFIGSVNFLCDWLPSLSVEIEPLTALLRNKPRKNTITRSLPLALPDSNSNILISTDASEKAIAGIIWKELEPSPPGTCLSKRKVMPISFYSRILTSSQQRWSTLQKEFFAIVMTLNQPNLSSFLLTRHLTIFCDHKNLSYLFSCPDSNRVVLRWIPVLQSFSFDCVPIEGPKNFWADYLSRASLLPEKKKEKKTRDICDNSTPELCCMMTYQDQAKSPLWNYLNLDDLRHYDTDRWYDIDYDTAERILHPSIILNSLKHFLHYNVNPEPYDYLASSSAKYFILSTDLPFLYKDVSAPKDYDFSYPLNLPSRLEIFETEPFAYNHERFLKEQAISSEESLPPREDSDQPIDVSSDSSDEVHLVSTITSSSTSDSSAQELLPSGPPSSPAAAFLNKIFKDQQKVSDNDPLQIWIEALQIWKLRRQLEERSRPPATPQSISRENRNLPLDQRYGNPLHEWDRFRAAAQVDPRRIASCVTPECLAALRAQGRFSSVSDSISAIDNINEEQIWESILHLSQYSTLETARISYIESR
ncbi:hypothetical protein P9112_000665 [Eukaryota sp. TZLM1-RC]